MTYEQCQRLINDLQGQRSKEAMRLNKMRRKIIGLGKEIGWPIAKVKEFCLMKGVHKKTLNGHDGTELLDLLNQFEKIVQNEKAKRPDNPKKK